MKQTAVEIINVSVWQITCSDESLNREFLCRGLFPSELMDLSLKKGGLVRFTRVLSTELEYRSNLGSHASERALVPISNTSLSSLLPLDRNFSRLFKQTGALTLWMFTLLAGETSWFTVSEVTLMSSWEVARTIGFWSCRGIESTHCWTGLLRRISTNTPPNQWRNRIPHKGDLFADEVPRKQTILVLCGVH